MSTRWLAESRDRSGVVARVGRSGERRVAEWIGVARLDAARDGTEARFFPDPRAPREAVEKVRRGSAQLLVRHLEGKLGLHAAAVAFEGRALAFLGASGDGKSTLAACACALHGAALLADDALALERGPDWLAVPLEQDHWLTSDARAALGLRSESSGGKTRAPASTLADGATPLGALVVLAFSDVTAPRVVPLAPVEALAYLVPLVVRFVVDEPEAQRRELDALGDLVADVPAVRLERPRDLAYLSDSFGALAAALRSRVPA